MDDLLLTFSVGLLCGFAFLKAKVPGGMMVGSIFGVAILSIVFERAYMPGFARFIAQVTAGAFIGCTVEKSDLARMKGIYKPALVITVFMLATNLLLGMIISWVSPLNLQTAFFSAVPGGMSDIPIIAADLGADVPKVAVLQFVRMVAGVGVFPGVIAMGKKRAHAVSEENPQEEHPAALEENPPQQSATPHGIRTVWPVFLCAGVTGLIGAVLKVPAGAMSFSMVGVIILKLAGIPVSMPLLAKRIAQVLAGAYIGCSIGYEDVLELKYLVLPSLVLLAGYFLNCWIVGHLLSKRFGMLPEEGMLAATPAGASDMALISSDMGVQSADLIVLQIIRKLVVVMLFPPIICWLVALSGG